MQSAWVSPVKSLCEILLHNEQSIQLLRFIDAGMRSVLKGKVTLESLLKDALLQLQNITGAGATHFYLLYRSYGDSPLHFYSTNSVHPSDSSCISRLLASKNWGETAVISLEQEADIAKIRTEPNTVAALLSLLPYPDQGVIGAVLLEFANPATVLDEATLTFVSAVCDQLSNLIHLRDEWRRRATKENLLSTFLDKKLKPSQCLQALASEIPNLLPDFGPLRLNPPPAVQILFYREGDKHLTIQASTSNDPIATRVEVKSSACGYLVEDRTLEYLLCDDKDPRYKWYLGRRIKEKMRSELAVPICDDGQLIAVLNFESTAEHAFYPQHIDAAKWAAKSVASWIAAIRDRIDVSAAKEKALTSVMEDYVVGYGRMLSHNFGNKVTGLVVTLDNLMRETAAAQPKLSERLGKAFASAQRFSAFLDDFISDPRDAAAPGPQSIRKIVKESVDVTRDLQHSTIEFHKIDIQIRPGDDYTVYCSKLLRQHLCNVLDNALYWVVKRCSADGTHRGEIVISIGPVPQDSDEPDSALNQQCVVKILDNGPGVSEDVLKELRGFPLNFTMRAQEGGTGYGLWALRQYSEGIGGRVELASKLGEYFEVSILLDVFNDLVHRQPKKWGSNW